MSRSLALIFPLLLIAAADGGPLPHASGAPAGAGPGCGGAFTAARGDTLWSIARRCETSITELVQENSLGEPPLLEAGQRLAIPGFAPVGPPKPPEAAPVPAPPPPPPRDEVGVYRFQAGDTLYSLARWARTSLSALLAANPGIAPRDIDAGAPIILPRGARRPEAMRLRERGAALRPALSVPSVPPRPVARPARLPPPPSEDAEKPRREGPTPGGMDDGRPAPDGM